MSGGILERGNIVWGDIVLTGYCPGGYCPGDIVRGDIVLEPCVCVCHQILGKMTPIRTLFLYFRWCIGQFLRLYPSLVMILQPC